MRKILKFFVVPMASILLFSCNEPTVQPTITPLPTPTVVVDYKDCSGLVIEKEKINYNDGENVTLDDMKVFAVNLDGTNKIEVSKYEVSFYQDDVEVSGLESLKAGRYQIWVEATINGLELSTFEFIYVNAHLKSLKLNDKEEGSLFKQKVGDDIMLSTWRFTLTYTNDWTRVISMSTNGISYDKDTYNTKVPNVGNVLVTYKEENNEIRSVFVPFEVFE